MDPVENPDSGETRDRDPIRAVGHSDLIFWSRKEPFCGEYRGQSESNEGKADLDGRIGKDHRVIGSLPAGLLEPQAAHLNKTSDKSAWGDHLEIA